VPSYANKSQYFPQANNLLKVDKQLVVAQTNWSKRQRKNI
jgi:hypothetical protein